jgi:dihydroflavonol-4-reductase
MTNMDIVFHAAGYYPKGGDPHKVTAQVDYARSEIKRVLGAARQTGVSRLVYTSSLTTIGQPPEGEERLADERDVYVPGSLPKSGYYESKIIMEKAVLESVENGLDTVTLNPCAVFGPGDVHLTLGGILIAVSLGYALAWVPATINVVDVRDVAAAHIRAAEIGRSGERYILGGHNLSVKDALTKAARIAGASPPRFKIPLWVIDGLVSLTDLVPFMSLPSNHLRAIRLWQGYNTSKAQQELDLTPRPFSTTVKEALDWLRGKGYVN